MAAALTAALAVTDEPLLRAFFVGFATLMLLMLAESIAFSDFLAKFFAVADLRWVGAASAGVALLFAMLFNRMSRPREAGREADP